MFERFTDQARRVVVLAEDQARLLNHNFVGTEHILLGLIAEGEGVAAKVLEELGVSLDAARAQIEAIIGTGGSSPGKQIPFTPRTKKVLELSLREALKLGNNYVGTEHILLGLLREGEGVGAEVLRKRGIELREVKERIIRALAGTAEPAPAGGHGGTRRDSPASSRAMAIARELAKAEGRPVRSDDLLVAMLHDENSVAAKALKALGVTGEALVERATAIGVAGSSDEFPEEVGARTIELQVLDDRVVISIADAELVERFREALGQDQPSTIAGTDPRATRFPRLYLILRDALNDVAANLKRTKGSANRGGSG